MLVLTLTPTPTYEKMGENVEVYYKQAIELMNKISMLLGRQVIFTVLDDPINVGDSIIVEDGDLFNPKGVDKNTHVEEGNLFNPKRVDKNTCFEECLDRFFDVNPRLTSSAKLIQEFVSKATGISFTSHRDIPFLMGIYMSKHPEFNITKKRNNSGVIYSGLGIKVISKTSFPGGQAPLATVFPTTPSLSLSPKILQQTVPLYMSTPNIVEVDPHPLLLHPRKVNDQNKISAIIGPKTFIPPITIPQINVKYATESPIPEGKNNGFGDQ